MTLILQLKEHKNNNMQLWVCQIRSLIFSYFKIQ